MPETAGGLLKLKKSGGGVLCDPLHPFGANAHDIVVPPRLVRAYALVHGAHVTGPVRKHKTAAQLVGVRSVCGLSPERFKKRTPYTHLVAIDPSERFQLAATGEMSMRVVDLLAPIGKGTRGLIVSPPKAGKTTLLQQMATAIGAGDPETRVIVLLIDERPEEVTHFRRTVEAEVIASSSDRSIAQHTALAELMLAHVATELECGRHIVVLVDSLTRMGRVFNLKGRGRGRTLSGGLDARALEIPRRFFGLARNIENGGSVTIIATALIDTGSRMDQLIFEEFKGTGNSEIVLDRGLAEARVFPAINVAASGTRKEERLYDPAHMKRLATIRRGLVERQPKDAMTALLKGLGSYPTNEEFLEAIPKDIAAFTA